MQIAVLERLPRFEPLFFPQSSIRFIFGARGSEFFCATGGFLRFQGGFLKICWFCLVSSKIFYVHQLTLPPDREFTGLLKEAWGSGVQPRESSPEENLAPGSAAQWS